MATFPDPSGGSMEVANEEEARERGWTPSMGSFGAESYPEGGGGGGQQTSGETPGTGGGTIWVAGDGQSLTTQTGNTQAMFRAQWGDRAEQQWATEHNAALGLGPPAPQAQPGTGAPAAATPGTPGKTTTVVQQQGGQEYGAAIQRALDALASGNREAFQRAIHEFDVAFQLDKDKFAEDTRRFNEQFGVTQAGLTGQYQGAPTLPALTSYATQFGTWGVPNQGAQTLANQQQQFAQQQALAQMYGQAYGGFGQVPGGQATLAAQQQAYAQQMGMINQAASLQANPFRQQQALGQMSGLLQGGGVAGFSAPNTVAGVGVAGGNTQGGMGYLQTMIDDIRSPGANEASMNQILNATPTPNKLNSVEFLRAAPSTQSLTLQAMQEKYGLDPADSLKQIQATMPAFQAPTTMGGIRR